MRRRSVWRAVLVGALMAGVLGACGDDDDDEAATDTTAAETSGGGGDSGDNTLEVEMLEYGYKVEGELKTGLATISTTNTGDEWHMAGFAKLKEGKTVDEVAKALQSAGGPPEGGEATLRAASAAAQAEGGEPAQGQEGEGGEGGDPFAEFFEEELGTPGHVLQPGQSQSLTVDVLDAGNYVMICFLPTEGEGTPHFAKGMLAGFEVAEEAADVAEPEADATITLDDEAEPAGIPADLESGEHTFKITSSGTAGKDFAIGQLKEGNDFKAFDTYFETEFEKEGGPEKGVAAKAPGTILGMSFEVKPGETIWITLELKKGETFFVNTTNSEDDSEDEDAVDKFVTVNVT